MSSFATRLLELRSARGLSQKDLAEEIGMAKSSISMYERGERLPSYEVQEAIADYFNVDIDYLIGRSDRTTVVLSSADANPKRRFLMDKIAKADDEKIRTLEAFWRAIDDDQTNNGF